MHKQILDRVISGVKDQVKNLRTMPSGVLKQLAYAHTINHLAEAYKSIARASGSSRGHWTEYKARTRLWRLNRHWSDAKATSGVRRFFAARTGLKMS